MLHRIIIGLLLAIALAVATSAAQFDYDEGRKIAVDLPEGWSAKSSRGDGGALEIAVKSTSEKKMMCQVTVLHAPPPADERLLDPDKLRTTVGLISQFKGIRAKPTSIATVVGIGACAFDDGGLGLAMITPEKGVSITVHFGRVKNVDQLMKMLGSFRVLTPKDA